MQNLNPALSDAIVQQEFLQAESPDQARQAVLKNAFYDVDVIKVSVEDDITGEALAAIVDEARRQGLKVAAHAITEGSIQTAIDAGVASIEHGNEVTTDQLRMMRDKGMFFDFTPTVGDGLWSRIHETKTRGEATAGDPVADIGELQRVRFVMKGGQVVRNEILPH